MQSDTRLNLIDTHAHCYLEAMVASKKDWMQRINENQIEKILLPNIDIDSIEPLHELCDEYPTVFLPMMGLHPCDVKEDYRDILERIQTILYANPTKYCGVGEIGLDYHWDTSFISHQKIALEMQFEWAMDLNKAVSIHSRKSNHDTIPLVTKYSKKGLRGVMHCFTGSIEEANRIVETGFYLGIGGVLTYPNSGLQEIIKTIDLKHLVLETDSPFLAPVPYRGKQNESSYILDIAKCLAVIKGIHLEEVALQTTENAKKCFQF